MRVYILFLALINIFFISELLELLNECIIYLQESQMSDLELVKTSIYYQGAS